MSAPNLAAASLSEIAHELAARGEDDFVLLFHDRDRDEWGIELNERLDPTIVVQLLETFKQAMLRMLAQHLSQGAVESHKAATGGQSLLDVTGSPNEDAEVGLGP